MPPETAPPRPTSIEKVSPNAARKAAVHALRQQLARMEGVPKDETRALPFGVPALDRHLPHGGLAFGTVHEITSGTEADRPAAFGFLMALLGRMPAHAPLLFVHTAKTFARIGNPHGQGLSALGLDPARLRLVEASDEAEAFWATEEALRAEGPVAVASAIGGRIDLKTSQRLHHAAREAGLPLLLLRPERTSPVPTASTRWRIAAATGPRDRFGLLAGWRWRVALDRCRNGRPGDWVLEFDHVTHRFALAAAVAGASLFDGGTKASAADAG